MRCIGQYFWSLTFYIHHIHHHRRFLFRQHGRNLLGIGRDYRFHESGHRVPCLRSCLAIRFYHRVNTPHPIDSTILTNHLGSPLIGGTFSSPANTFPNLFNHDFFRSYPYFLPGCIASIICLTGAIFGYVFLEEVSSLHGVPTSMLTCYCRLCPANAEGISNRSPRNTRGKNRHHILFGCSSPCRLYVPSACLEPGSVSRIRPLTYSLSFSVTRPLNLVVSHSLYVAPYFAIGPLIYW